MPGSKASVGSKPASSHKKNVPSAAEIAEKVENERRLAEEAAKEEEKMREEEARRRAEEQKRLEDEADRNRVIFAQPLKEIVQWPVKIRELYLGKRDINRLRDFEQFLNLEVLWLNGNRLRSLDGIESLWKLKELYVHDNRIETLGRTLDAMKHLQLLTLQNNRLTDLHQTMSSLKHMELQELHLYNNPLTEDPKYSSTVLRFFPSIEIVDRHRITASERRKARIESFNPDLAGRPSPTRSPSLASIHSGASASASGAFMAFASPSGSPSVSRSGSLASSAELPVPLLVLSKRKTYRGPVVLSDRSLSVVEKELYRELERFKLKEEAKRKQELEELKRKYPWRYETYSRAKIVENEFVEPDAQRGNGPAVSITVDGLVSARSTPGSRLQSSPASVAPSAAGSRRASVNFAPEPLLGGLDSSRVGSAPASSRSGFLSPNPLKNSGPRATLSATG